MKTELLKPKIDVVFHTLFREENKRLTEGLIGDILGEEVKVISSDNDRYLNIKNPEQKLGIMDLRTELDGGIKCNIEIQLERTNFEIERFLYYWADAYSRQLLRGEEYSELKKTISIIIVEHEIENLKHIKNLGTKWQIRDNETGQTILTNKLELVIIEIPKAKRAYIKNEKDKIGQWMIFIDNPNQEEVEKIVDENRRIREAREKLEEISADYETVRIAELIEKGRRDRVAAMQYATEHGWNKGLKAGEEAGMKAGRKKGRKEGERRGKAEEKQRIAKSMLEEGIDIEKIAKITGLKKEEIEKLQK